MEDDPGCRLYLISPSAIPDPVAFAATLDEALAAGDVASFQLRLKGVDDDTIIAVSKALMPVCHQYTVAFILNDRPDLAAKLNCDGVHIGPDDMAYDEARRIVGPDMAVGVTCKGSRHDAMEAAEDGADYVAFGAFFPSATKDVSDAIISPEVVESWTMATTVPCVAIGGITVDNCDVLIEVGADFLAVGGGVWNYPQGPAAAVQAFNEKFAALGRASN